MVQANAGRGESAKRRRRRWKWTEAEKAGYLKQLAASDLTLEAFCREHGLSRTVVGRWRRAVRAGRGRATRTDGFATVALTPTVPLERRERSVGLTMVVRWPSGVTAELAGLDVASADAVVTTLGSLGRAER